MFSFLKKKKNVPQEEQKSVQHVDYEDVTDLANYFQKETGVTFEKQKSILKNKLMTFCKQRELASFGELLKRVDSDEHLKQELIDYLTTNETFFYRELKQIHELVILVQKSLQNVDILCAPSATREEPYSIAIALLEAGVSSTKFSIVGIDINSDAIKKAQAAVYRQRNVRNLSDEVIAKYFHENNGSYSLKSSIKSLVTFRVENLFDASFKHIGKFDFIFSRNMLIYFDKETKIKAKEILESLRKEDKHPVFFGHADLF